jgi:CubicO group peptidase (beta-lactamase class C family)
VESLCSYLALGTILPLTLAFAQAAVETPVPPDAEIRKILANRVGAENLGIGMVAGVIDARGRRVIAYGSLAKDDWRPLNGDTIFEIGSMTKVFTSLVLMDMARKGEVSVTDPISKYLPPSQGSGKERQEGYPAGSGDTELRSAAAAIESQAERRIQSLCRLYG